MGLCFGHSLCLDLDNLVLDLGHLFFAQRIELHGNQVADQTDGDQAVCQEHNANTQLRGNDIAHAGVVVGKAAGSKYQTGDHGSERGNHLIHKAEQGAHQTGNILAGAVYFIVGTVGGHGNYDIAGNTLAAGIQDAEHNIGDQEGAPVQCTGFGVAGHCCGVANNPQGGQDNVADNAADGANDHGFFLAKAGGNDGDNQEGEDDAGDGGNGGHAALQFDGTGNAGKHSNGNSAGFGSGAELIRGGGQHQHLDGAVVFQGIPVVFQADLDGFASAKEFRAVFGCNGDDGDHGKDGGHNGGHHPEFMEELGRGIVANISILVGNVGNDNSQHRKQDGIEHAIERSEHGALFGIVGHAALGALGNNALAGVAQVINAAERNKENKAGGAFRQFVGKVEHDKAGSRQNDVANDHERAIFAELAVGFIHHVANERVSYAVPDTHSHGKAGCHDHANANKAQ